MKNKKISKIITISAIVLVIIISLLVFILNYSKDDTSFSIMEKSWINDNKDQKINVSIYNDVPIYGLNGEGIAFELLNSFTKKYDIEFNRISYFITNKSNDYEDVSFKVLDYNQKLNNNQILMYEDNYVIISRKNTMFNYSSEIRDITLGILNSDLGAVSGYLADASNINYLSYDSFATLISAYETEAVDYLVLPNNLYLKEILSHDGTYIVYHLGDISYKYVLEVNNNDKLLSILKKYYKKYQLENYEDLYSEYFVNLFFSTKELTDQEKVTYNSVKYNYGFVKNMPFEEASNNQFVGILSNYIKSFASVTNASFKFTEYASIKDLKEAFNNGEIDVAFGNYNSSNMTNTKTGSLFQEKYVVLAHDDYYVTSIKSLQEKKVMAVKDSYIYDYLVNNNVKVKGYKSINDLLINIDNDSIVVIDYGNYQYYHNKKFSNYKLLYEGILKDDYGFILKDNDQNESFNKIFTYYVSSVDYNRVKYQYNTKIDITNPSILTKIIKYALIFLGIFFILVVILLMTIRRKKLSKSIKKEEKFKFIDMMTSLKNRNYLNYNIKKWDDNIIFPQAIIVVDLNHIKLINDTHGHEEGDNVIKKAASVLIVNQLENSDVIRTDGNEFLIYLVGYDEKQVINYIRKIYKDLKELPHGYGAAIGYSMILDEIKSIDDAINEATIEMRNNKEKMK